MKNILHIDNFSVSKSQTRKLKIMHVGYLRTRFNYINNKEYLLWNYIPWS